MSEGVCQKRSKDAAQPRQTHYDTMSEGSFLNTLIFSTNVIKKDNLVKVSIFLCFRFVSGKTKILRLEGYGFGRQKVPYSYC